jgi:hypothetical protein
MKAIQPLSIWVNGTMKQANKLNLYVVNDDLKSSCTFYYSLVKETENVNSSVPEPLGEEAPEPVVTYSIETLAQGNLVMTGDEYDDWNIEEDINGAAYEWAAGKLGLKLV